MTSSIPPPLETLEPEWESLSFKASPLPVFDALDWRLDAEELDEE